MIILTMITTCDKKTHLNEREKKISSVILFKILNSVSRTLIFNIKFEFINYLVN